MATTDSSPDSQAAGQQSGAAAPTKFGELLEKLNRHAASQNWGPNKSQAYRLQMADLAVVGSRAVEGMGDLPAGGLTDAQATQMAKDILAKNERAQKIKANMEQTRSGLIGGTVKASGSALGGAAKGAMIGTILAIASRPINWLVSGATGGKVSFKGSTVIGLTALLYAGKNILPSLSNSFVEPGRHNRTVDEMSLDAVKAGIMRGVAARTQTPGPGASGPESAGPSSPTPGGPAPEPQAGPDAAAKPAAAVVPTAMASTVVASSSEVPTAPAADIAQKVQAALDQVKELPRGAKLPVENVVAVNFAPEKTPDMDKPKQITV